MAKKQKGKNTALIEKKQWNGQKSKKKKGVRNEWTSSKARVRLGTAGANAAKRPQRLATNVALESWAVEHTTAFALLPFWMSSGKEVKEKGEIENDETAQTSAE